ncbi:hypothetical protein PAMP_015348 [Pampus punctatissimus]
MEPPQTGPFRVSPAVSTGLQTAPATRPEMLRDVGFHVTARTMSRFYLPQKAVGHISVSQRSDEFLPNPLTASSAADTEKLRQQ